MNIRNSTMMLCWLLVCWMLAACQSTVIQDAGITQPVSQPTLEPTIRAAQDAIQSAWEAGPHSATYDLEKGPNTYCAKCHSPTNWDPAAKVDPPPNCVSCKFEFEMEPRNATGNPLVPEDEWDDIGCSVCHRVQEDGLVSEEIFWHDSRTNYYMTVVNSTELCEKCHRDTETIRHQRDLGTEVHKDFVCTDCHDPHQLKANCTTCHPVFFDGREGSILTEGHIPEHAHINCVACHDATGLEVGPIEGQNVWIAFRTTSLLGREVTNAYQSHNLTREVNCSRCHDSENQWGLSTVEEGDTP